MLVLEASVLGIVFLSYLLPKFFIEYNSFEVENKIIDELKNYNDVENFIKTKIFEFEIKDRRLILIVTISIALFVGVTINTLALALAQLILGIGMLGSLSLYMNTRKFNQEIIRKLYKLKDKKSKS